MQSLARWPLAALLLFAACGSPPHDGAYDPESPLDKLARGTVAGSVSLENETDASQVSIVLAGTDRRYEATTDKAGAFVVTSVVPGRYTVTANARYFSDVQAEVDVPIGGAVTAPALALQALRGAIKGSALAKVLAGQTQLTQGGVLVTLRRTGSLHAAGAPAFRAAAAAETPGVTLQTFSDGEGSWEMGDVPAGAYEIEGSYSGVPPKTLADITVDGAGTVDAPDLLLEPLTGFFEIVGTQDGLPSSLFTSVTTVTLRLTGLNAQKMKIGFAGPAGCVYANPAVTLQAQYPLDLTAEGLNTVCVRYVSATGEETDDLTQSINFDATKPVVHAAQFVAQQGYVDVNVPVLSLTASDENSGLKYVQFANTLGGLATAPKLTYQSSFVVTLPAPGFHVYWVRVVDEAGNYADPVTAWVTLDTTPPVLSSMTVNGGAAFTTNNNLTVATSADATSVEMQISESSVFSGAPWFPYQTSVNYATSIPNGAKTIYARVRDPLGRTSNVISQVITLDAQAPTGLTAAFAYAATKTTSNTLAIAAVDNLSAPANLLMRISGNVATVNGTAGNVNAWIAFATSAVVGFTGTGAKGVTVEVKDQAGNVASTSTSLTIDTAGPVGTVTLLAAAGGNRHATLGWTAVSGAAYYVVEAMKGPYTGAFTKTEPDLVVTATGATFTGLKNNADYAFRVRSYDAVGNADTSYSNVLVAAIGTAQRAMSWPGVTQKLLDFKVSDGALTALVKDSNGSVAIMRSLNNGTTWAHTAFSGSPYFGTGSLAATPSSLLAVYEDTGGLKFQYSSDGGQTFTNYQLATFNFAQYNYKPAVAADGNFAVVVGGKISGTTGRVDMYWSRSGNGGANSFGWSTPVVLPGGTAIQPYDATAAVCVSGGRARIVYRIPSTSYDYLATYYTADAGVTWTFQYIDTTSSMVIDDNFHCVIDARGSSYVTYRRTVGGTTLNRLWVNQQDYFNPAFDVQTIPTSLPGGGTANWVNGRVWVNELAELYFAAQDANTNTLWLSKIYLGDGGWNVAANWEMRQIDAFPTAGSALFVDGEGQSDVRVLYEVSATAKVRLYTPLLPAPTSFRSMLTNTNSLIATWTPPQGLDQFTVYAGSNYINPQNSFETSSDTVSYPNAGYFNSVASRDAYGTGARSNVYENIAPYTTQLSSTPSGTPARAVMNTDPAGGDAYVVVTQGTQLWFTRLYGSNTTFNWSVVATMGANIQGADVKAYGSKVYVTYCNASGIFMKKSTNYGSTWGSAVQVYSSFYGTRGSTCAIGVSADDTNVVIIGDNTNDGWEYYKSTNGGVSFAYGVEFYATCGSGSGNAVDADIMIDPANAAYQVVGLHDLELGDCNTAFVTSNNWSSNTELGGLGGGLAFKVGIHRGLVYGLSGSTLGVDFAIGSVKGTGWIAQAKIDSGANQIAGVVFDGANFVAAYTTDSGLQLATCAHHCTIRTSWAQATVLPAASTALGVVGLGLGGTLSYGVFGSGQTALRHYGNQGPFTDVPMP